MLDDLAGPKETPAEARGAVVLPDPALSLPAPPTRLTSFGPELRRESREISPGLPPMIGRAQLRNRAKSADTLAARTAGTLRDRVEMEETLS